MGRPSLCLLLYRWLKNMSIAPCKREQPHCAVFCGLQNIPPGCFGWAARAPPWHRPVGLFSSKRLPPFVTKRPAAPRPGCRLRCRAEGFLLSFSIAKRKKQRKRLPSEGVPPSAEGGRGALPPRLPCKPLKRLDRNFTGLRP